MLQNVGYDVIFMIIFVLTKIIFTIFQEYRKVRPEFMQNREHIFLYTDNESGIHDSRSIVTQKYVCMQKVMLKLRK